MTSKKINSLIILFAIGNYKLGPSICKLSDNTVAYMCKAILLYGYLQVSCEIDVTFYSSLLHLRAALAPVRLHTCTGSYDSLLPANANELAKLDPMVIIRWRLNISGFRDLVQKYLFSPKFFQEYY